MLFLVRIRRITEAKLICIFNDILYLKKCFYMFKKLWDEIFFIFNIVKVIFNQLNIEIISYQSIRKHILNINNTCHLI